MCRLGIGVPHANVRKKHPPTALAKGLPPCLPPAVVVSSIPPPPLRARPCLCVCVQSISIQNSRTLSGGEVIQCCSPQRAERRATCTTLRTPSLYKPPQCPPSSTTLIDNAAAPQRSWRMAVYWPCIQTPGMARQPDSTMSHDHNSDPYDLLMNTSFGPCTQSLGFLGW